MLTNKYLKYSPEITLEIFTLVYNKLIDNGWKPYSWQTIDDIWEYLTKKNWLGIKDGFNKKFIQYKNSQNDGLEETTVQEILGYDPFVKDDFVLPEKWYIEVGHNSLEINKWKKTTEWKSPAESFKYVDYRGVGIMMTSALSHCTEITFDQFKKYVLKEQGSSISEQMPTSKDWRKATKEELLEEAKRRYPIGTKYHPVNSFEKKVSKRCTYTTSGDYIYIDGYICCNGNLYGDGVWAEVISLPETKVESKVVIPEYVECINKSEGFTIGKIYKTDSTSGVRWYRFDKDDNGRQNGWGPDNFKPSTKEAFDAQNKPKPIEKWSVGSYVVALIDNAINILGFNKGRIAKCNKDGIYFGDQGWSCSQFSEDKGYVKWFATKSEAEEFAKTLVEPVKHDNGILNAVEVKQPLKQAVHCRTQEEWDFACDKYGKSSKTKKDFPTYNTFDYIYKFNGWYTLERYIQNGYEILSFQEWCDLNGYKMDNKFKFEIGKWYIFDWEFNKGGKVLLKVSGIRDTWIETNNRIYLWNNSVGRGRDGYLINGMSNIKELSIEEIQQYLPDNHPDKIKPNNNLENMNITELHEKGLVKDFFYEVIGEGFTEDALDEDGDLCEYGKFDSMNCIGISCSGCLLHKNNRSKLTELLKPNKPKELNDFKVGDRVVGWHLPGSDLDVTPWVTGRIQGEYAFPTGHSLYCTYFKDIRHISESKEQLFPIFEDKSSMQIKEIEIKQNYFIDFKDPYS